MNYKQLSFLFFSDLLLFFKIAIQSKLFRDIENVLSSPLGLQITRIGYSSSNVPWRIRWEKL